MQGTSRVFHHQRTKPTSGISVAYGPSASRYHLTWLLRYQRQAQRGYDLMNWRTSHIHLEGFYTFALVEMEVTEMWSTKKLCLRVIFESNTYLCGWSGRSNAGVNGWWGSILVWGRGFLVAIANIWSNSMDRTIKIVDHEYVAHWVKQCDRDGLPCTSRRTVYEIPQHGEWPHWFGGSTQHLQDSRLVWTDRSMNLKDPLGVFR